MENSGLPDLVANLNRSQLHELHHLVVQALSRHEHSEFADDIQATFGRRSIVIRCMACANCCLNRRQFH